jgi:hypothetical protein
MAHNPFFELSRRAIGTTQAGLGKMLGVSRRTAQRWSESGVPGHSLALLAEAVHPYDASLAGQIASTLGTTLEALGIVQPPPLPPPASPAPPAPPPSGVVDAVVCAAAEAMNMTPRDVRPGLHAAFARAKEIGLTVDVVERALGLKLGAPAEPVKRGKASA